MKRSSQFHKRSLLPGVNIWSPRFHQIRKSYAKVAGRYGQVCSDPLVWRRLQHSKKQAHVLFTELGADLGVYWALDAFLQGKKKKAKVIKERNNKKTFKEIESKRQNSSACSYTKTRELPTSMYLERARDALNWTWTARWSSGDTSTVHDRTMSSVTLPSIVPGAETTGSKLKFNVKSRALWF